MNSWRFTSQALRQDFCRAHAAFFLSGAVPLLSTVMLLAIIVTTPCKLRTGVARDMRT